MSLIVRLEHHPPNLFQTFFEWQLQRLKPQWQADSPLAETWLHTSSKMYSQLFLNI